MKKNFWGFQGDVVFIKSDFDVEGLKKLNTNVLMDGEVQGHKHRIVEGDFKLYEKEGVLYLSADTDLKVEHEEHKTTVILPGKYIVDRPREMDHVSRMERRVID